MRNARVDPSGLQQMQHMLTVSPSTAIKAVVSLCAGCGAGDANATSTPLLSPEMDGTAALPPPAVRMVVPL